MTCDIKKVLVQLVDLVPDIAMSQYAKVNPLL